MSEERRDGWRKAVSEGSEGRGSEGARERGSELGSERGSERGDGGREGIGGGRGRHEKLKGKVGGAGYRTFSPPCCTPLGAYLPPRSPTARSPLFPYLLVSPPICLSSLSLLVQGEESLSLPPSAPSLSLPLPPHPWLAWVMAQRPSGVARLTRQCPWTCPARAPPRRSPSRCALVPPCKARARGGEGRACAAGPRPPSHTAAVIAACGRPACG